MHKTAYEYVAQAVQGLDLKGKAVVEFGSADVNGSVRPLFTRAGHYAGIDRRKARGVDIVADAAGWGEGETFDVVVSTSMLEHAENAEAVIANAGRLLVPGGILILTAAGPSYPPHGNDGGPVGGEFYRAIGKKDLTAWLKAAGFVDLSVELANGGSDLFATARKAEK